MVKEVARWGITLDQLFCFALDADGCQGTNVKSAETVDCSLTKHDYSDCRDALHGVSTDAGVEDFAQICAMIFLL